MIYRTDIINILIDKYNLKSYLEIGVDNPEVNFDKIKIQYKHSVDPYPKGPCTFIMTSDEFFKNIINQKYDIIFIDGLHTLKQSYNDIINSIKYLNDNGFIIVHDCNPMLENFTIPYQQYMGGAWTGDVYKAFIKIKSELLDWSCFVIDEDWGCGIITKLPILKNNSIDIKNLDWNKFSKNRNKLLQLISFNDFLSLI